MTYEELYTQLCKYLNIPKGITGYPVPRMLSNVAENLFVDGEMDSEFAEMIRHQLKHLEEHGLVDVERKSK